MNRKKLFSLAMLVIMFTTVLGVNANTLCRISPQWLQLQVRYDNPVQDKPIIPKSPVHVPDVYQEGHTLTFDESCDECTLRIVNDEDEVEFTTIIMSNTVVLLSTLQGEYEIQIIRGNYCFYGDIEL